MTTGLNEYKTKHKDLISKAVQELVSDRSPDWKDTVQNDAQCACKAALYAYTISITKDTFPAIFFHIPKIIHLTNWWMRDIAEYAPGVFSGNDDAFFEYLEKYFLYNDIPSNQLIKLMAWLKSGAKDENSKKYIRSIIASIEDLAKLICYAIELNDYERRSAINQITNLIRTESETQNSFRDQTEMIIGIEVHETLEKFALSAATNIPTEDASFINSMSEDKNLPVILYLLILIIFNIESLTKQKLNSAGIELFKKIISEFGANKLLCAASGTMIAQISNSFASEDNHELIQILNESEELGFGLLLGSVLLNGEVKQIFDKEYRNKFLDAIQHISTQFVNRAGIDDSQKQKISQSVELGVKNAIDLFGNDGELMDQQRAFQQYDRSTKPSSTSNEEERCENSKTQAKIHKNLGESIIELESLIGLDSIKSEVTDLITVLNVMKERRESGLKVPEFTRHMVFTGNPGTGKTSVARLLANIYRELGFLSKGHFTEVDRSNLVGGYLGQTAIKTKRVLEDSLGGILFIDEAYSLAQQDGNDPYGSEAIETIIKYMEDNREDLIIIVAGYPEEMRNFLDSNPGIKSRFSKQMNFPDYSASQLSQIFLKFMKDSEYEPGDDFNAHLDSIFDEMIFKKDKKFGNARSVRILFERSIINHSKRISLEKNIENTSMVTLEKGDVIYDDIYAALGRSYA
jgi:stage V sporulation protein K